jgi:hypothetical protein
MNVVYEAWQDYRLRVVPLDASSIQVAETRRAYYAGAGAVVKALLRTSGSVPTPQRLAVDEVQQELLRFQADVEAGRA